MTDDGETQVLLRVGQGGEGGEAPPNSQSTVQPLQPGCTLDAYAVSRYNALRHGILSQHTILPWEDPEEYQQLLAALAAEHRPEGPTEEHLVEELAGIIWRKKRLRLAELSNFRRGLLNACASYQDTDKAALAHIRQRKRIEGTAESVQASDEDTKLEQEDLADDRQVTEKALKILASGKDGAYEKALQTVRRDTREWWEDILAGELGEDERVRYAAAADGLHKFLQREVGPWIENRQAELENRPLVTSQAHGEAVDRAGLKPLIRYEAHLDRKLERTPAMLLKLQELRHPRETESVS